MFETYAAGQKDRHLMCLEGCAKPNTTTVCFSCFRDLTVWGFERKADHTSSTAADVIRQVCRRIPNSLQRHSSLSLYLPLYLSLCLSTPSLSPIPFPSMSLLWLWNGMRTISAKSSSPIPMFPENTVQSVQVTRTSVLHFTAGGITKNRDQGGEKRASALSWLRTKMVKFLKRWKYKSGLYNFTFDILTRKIC